MIAVPVDMIFVLVIVPDIQNIECLKESMEVFLLFETAEDTNAGNLVARDWSTYILINLCIIGYDLYFVFESRHLFCQITTL